MDKDLKPGDMTHKNRPSVLDTMSETQMEELEQQFKENDRSYFNELGNSYGWSEDQTNAVWEHFGENPLAGHEGEGGNQ